jgi:hypothetical protein
VITTALVALKDLLIESREKNLDASRFALLTRIFFRLNDVMTLIGLAGRSCSTRWGCLEAGA